ncbi:hypothetical protein FS837_001446 [Tulasnella sp. UAMH 9824]|nr:hypothetical protein FS837_001446 [Tulasnella sp. UAMH 9824]
MATDITSLMSEFESSSDSSSNENFGVKQRCGSAYILCGYSAFVDVVEILTDGTPLKNLRKWSAQLPGFRIDDLKNLVCFCRNHHQEYKTGCFAIVPSPNVRKQMKEHEVRDFELRQQAISTGSPDPGRTLLMPPQLPYEFEYVPIAVPFYHEIHNETPLYPETFLFNSQNMFASDTLRVGDTLHLGTGPNAKSIQVREYPLRCWEVSHYAALMAAFEPLHAPDRLLDVGSNTAFNEVTELVDLYQRHAATQGEASLGGAEVEEGLGNGDDGLESQSTNTERPGPVDYDDEPAVTPAVLSSRLRWTPAMSAYSSEGSMRFATSSNFVRNPSDEPWSDIVYLAPLRPTTLIPMYNLESSSSSSSNENLAIKQRFGSACIICGYTGTVEVAKILADSALLQKLRKWSCELSGFRADHFKNLVCFCPDHHEEYKAGAFVIVPSPNVRKQMKEHEVRDLELRQRAIDMGLSDPGRHLLMPPELPYEFEYVPITVPYYLYIHNSTSLLPKTFLYNSQKGAGMEELPLRPWEVSVYAALMAACEFLRDPGRILSPQSDAAFNEVTELVTMYRQHTATQVQASPGEAEAVGEEVEEGLGDGNDDLESQSTNTGEPDPEDYDDEPAVTPNILSSRIRWTPAMSAYSSEGFMRFATSSDFVRDPLGEPQEE